MEIGFVSTAVYLISKNDIKKIHEIREKNENVRKYVDFHLITATEVI